jgi:hypothetical protein
MKMAELVAESKYNTTEFASNFSEGKKKRVS